uniref:Icc protein n=1 Tax=Candidatus Kentrum sp. SD TaxID=2126332 RepID=A0A451BK54_9GAMM|nr:MAG: Icc protein [Candidatus Kentron sp. SD]
MGDLSIVTENLSDDAIARAFRVIQISDSHLLRDGNDLLKGVATWRTFQSVVERITQEDPRPDLVVATGDLAHDGSSSVYRRLREHLARIEAPVCVLPGNHDDPVLLAKAFGIDTEEDMTEGASGMSFGHANLANWLIVFLNTVAPGEQYGILGERELTRLSTLLRNHPNRHTLLCLHHHAIPRSNEIPNFPGLRDAERFLSIVDRHPQVRGVIWGHIHDIFEAKRKDTVFFGTPSTCFQFGMALGKVSLSDAPPAYRRLTLKFDGMIESEVVRLTGC